MLGWLRRLLRRGRMDPMDGMDPMGQAMVACAGKITRYGYMGDETPDSLTEAGWGAWNNQLTPKALAVSRDVEAAFRAAGIKPLDHVEIYLEDRPPIVRRWEDRTARQYNGKPLVGRYDLLDRDNKYRALDGLAVMGFAPIGPMGPMGPMGESEKKYERLL